MNSQINLLRQSILDLRQAEPQGMVDLRRQIDALEKSRSGNAKDRLDDIDTRLRTVEKQPRGSGMVRARTAPRWLLSRREGQRIGDLLSPLSKS